MGAKAIGGVMRERFNMWFDSLEEPQRFCLFLVIILPGIMLTSIRTPLPILLGGLYIGILIFLRFPKWNME